MSVKTGISTFKAKDVEDGDELESNLWKDDYTGELSISLADPWGGYTSSRDILALAKKLTAWGNKMKRAGQ